MSIYKPKGSFRYITNNFCLDVDHSADSTHVFMKLNSPYVSTRDYPETYNLVKKYLSSALNTQCFNLKNLPFSEELYNTEVGHLFEHLLLEYLCQEKVRAGDTEAIYNGLTAWNWEIEEFGTFEVFIDAGLQDLEVFTNALGKAIELTEKILNSPKKKKIAPLSYFLQHS